MHKGKMDITVDFTYKAETEDIMHGRDNREDLPLPGRVRLNAESTLHRPCHKKQAAPQRNCLPVNLFFLICFT